MTEQVLEAIDLFARLEGLIHDPVYSGKGAAGLIGLVRSGELSASANVLSYTPAVRRASSPTDQRSRYRFLDPSVVNGLANQLPCLSPELP